MKLHEAMFKVLSDKLDNMAYIQELSDAIFEQNLYLREDDQKIEPWQIRRRAINHYYRYLFEIVDNDFIRLSSHGKLRIGVSYSSVYNLLVKKGSGYAESSQGTTYRIEALNGNIVAYPRRGRITIHDDCWGSNVTCQGTRAGGIYNGPYSIFNWFNDNK